MKAYTVGEMKEITGMMINECKKHSDCSDCSLEGEFGCMLAEKVLLFGQILKEMRRKNEKENS